MDQSLQVSSVHGILQVRILVWVAMPSSGGSFQSRDRTQVSCIAHGFFFYYLIHQGSPVYIHTCTAIPYTYTHIYSAPTHIEVETSSPLPLWRKRERAYLLLQSESKSFLGGIRELSLFQNVSIWHQEE